MEWKTRIDESELFPETKSTSLKKCSGFPVLVDVLSKFFCLLAVIELDDDPGLPALLVPLKTRDGEALLGVVVQNVLYLLFCEVLPKHNLSKFSEVGRPVRCDSNILSRHPIRLVVPPIEGVSSLLNDLWVNNLLIEVKGSHLILSSIVEDDCEVVLVDVPLGIKSHILSRHCGGCVLPAQSRVTAPAIEGVPSLRYGFRKHDLCVVVLDDVFTLTPTVHLEFDGVLVDDPVGVKSLVLSDLHSIITLDLLTSSLLSEQFGQ